MTFNAPFLQAVAPACPGCDSVKEHCRCRRCPTCGNTMLRQSRPYPTSNGVTLLVHLVQDFCPCCEDAAAIRAEQQRDPRGDAWPGAR